MFQLATLLEKKGPDFCKATKKITLMLRDEIKTIVFIVMLVMNFRQRAQINGSINIQLNLSTQSRGCFVIVLGSCISLNQKNIA